MQLCKRLLKWFLLLAPLLCWLGLVGYCIVGKRRANKGMADADGLVWGTGENRVELRLVSNLPGEIGKHKLTAVKQDGAVLQEIEFVVNQDHWGGGFVKAMQADQDPELEVVAWGHHEVETSFFLDHVNGNVEKKPFDEASSQAKERARYWHETTVMNPFVPVLTLFPLAGYYALAGLVLLVLRLVRRRRSSRSSPADRQEA